MPCAPLRRCSAPGCPNSQPCPNHTPAPWERGGTRDQRLPRNWPTLRATVLRRDGHACYLCGAHATEVDHVIHGDDHRLSNLAAICTACHRHKSATEGGRASARARASWR